MLVVAGEVLPNNVLSYLAFRVTFLETLERLALARQVGDEDEEEEFGFLTEVPFLSAVPPHVQLDLLAETWRKHSVRRRVSATLLDEAVVYAVCETAAHIARGWSNGAWAAVRGRASSWRTSTSRQHCATCT
ncbi:MAG: hypothetical protein GXP27_20490 [Planctomycetes bacterium]|nr:hypothetical protein [Planctomycetota bacterium]